MSLKYNKVVINNKVIIDLTTDTVTPETLLSGRVAHSSDGSTIVGTYRLPSFDISDVLKDSSGESVLDSSDSPIETDTGYVSLADHYSEVDGLRRAIENYELVIQDYQARVIDMYLVDSNNELVLDSANNPIMM